MTFFNRKEEVLDIQLTQFGKHLLSKGRFKPYYYAFFDDDVLYDAKFGGITTEIQNETETRIKEETPRMKTQYVFSGIESEISRDLQAQRERAVLDDSLDRNLPVLTTIQPEADLHYSNATPLGSAKVGSNKHTAWRVNFLKGELSGSTDVQTNTKQPVQTIPQLNTEVLYRTFVRQEAEMEVPHLHDDNEFSFDDGTFIDMEEDVIVLEIEEANTFLANSEFEIEIFKVEDEYSNGQLTGREILIPLKFQDDIGKSYDITENNIYVPRRPSEEMAPPVDRTNVEYFLDMDFDSQIDQQLMCQLKPADKTQGLFSRRAFECADDVDENQRTNIYAPEQEYEDPCED
tara:strand:+ start:1181 stop:2218 length:1038 start_codon:yes stop_codon:yes gene_type:complete